MWHQSMCLCIVWRNVDDGWLGKEKNNYPKPGLIMYLTHTDFGRNTTTWMANYWRGEIMAGTGDRRSCLYQTLPHFLLCVCVCVKLTFLLICLQYKYQKVWLSQGKQQGSENVCHPWSIACAQKPVINTLPHIQYKAHDWGMSTNFYNSRQWVVCERLRKVLVPSLYNFETPTEMITGLTYNSQ